MHKFDCSWDWRIWVVGLILPHGGMVVWSLSLGPLRISFWPLATKHPVF
jgi:hypothetical protein